jgi:pimeloyl-ACP methyl ester carboxylesterase
MDAGDDRDDFAVVLVHGAVHGAWCWAPTLPHLQADSRVRSVVALDLPGHGENRSIPDDDITLDNYVATVVDAVDSADLRNIVLVGHSLGGITITPAAHQLSDRLARLVYLTTTCPPAGKSVNDLLVEETRPAFRMGMDMPTIFCTDFDDDQREWLTSRLGNEPTGPFTTPVTIERPPAAVEAIYIRCQRDEALSAAYQTEHAERIGAEIRSLDAGHSPFVTHPAELTALILGGL